MKTAGFLLALICILSLTGCGMVASAEEEILQPETEENIMSVNFDDVATQNEPTEQYCEYLAKNTENMFTDEDGIESADAIVSYDEGTEQYSIELSLKTNGEVSGEQIELYKNILSKTYAEVVLVVDGSVM
ncbi:hypothetical protein D7V90_21720 [bacterium 1xD42-87]|nr:hypothetical protein D7V90_21720 [bacterium 1xD42-87]